ncbi:somatostatin receptor type 2-like [Toxorhynchites rutilus septentrionalis]|uniref:somatostatin receptor type 2-like n=1 Tax=Toxorhynchites rutilus septentrionalis TaxID=329112 RepID=UPI002479B5DC|nr:somatostatin receptor type 2-like [Toxorhynchites rutilus septentrionalis]
MMLEMDWSGNDSLSNTSDPYQMDTSQTTATTFTTSRMVAPPLSPPAVGLTFPSDLLTLIRQTATMSASSNLSYLLSNFNRTLSSTQTEFNLSRRFPPHPFFLPFYNDSAFDSCPSIQMPIGNLISMILYAVVAIIGLLGNTLVIYVVLRFSKMQTVTNMYILNLAIADQCFLIGIPFLITTMYLREWTFGNAMCKAYMVSTSITQFTSSIFLFIMSADRYIAVCHPISSPRFRTPLVSKIVSFFAWTASALIMLPVMLYANTIQREKDKLSCNIVWPSENAANSGTTFTLYSLILGFAIPLSLILMFYYLVIRKLRTVGPKSKSKEKKRSHRKVTKLVLTVITVYVLCWLPYWISQVALINSPPDICKSRLEITVFVLVSCLGYSNSAMNPILYAFLSDNFKKSFLKACTCTKGKDINAQLQIENSFFPRFGRNRGSERGNSTKILHAGRQKVADQSHPNDAVIHNNANIRTNVNNNNNVTNINNNNNNNNGNATATAVASTMMTTTTTTTSGGTSTSNIVPIASRVLDGGTKPPVLHTDL